MRRKKAGRILLGEPMTVEIEALVPTSNRFGALTLIRAGLCAQTDAPRVLQVRGAEYR